MPVHFPVKVAAFRAVLSRDAKYRGTEKPVNVGDRSPADNGERATGGFLKNRKQLAKISIDPRKLRFLRDVQQRSVDIQEKSRVRG